MMLSISFCLLCAPGLPQEPVNPGGNSGPADRMRAMAEEVSKQVAELRGKPFQGEVKVRVSGRSAFLEYARERMDSLHGPERMGLDEDVAQLAGMIPTDMNLEQVTLEVLQEQVGGFYEPSSDTFFVMEDLDPSLARLVMAHELAHALDDQYHDLDGTDLNLRTNSDALLAHHAVAEGSAQVVMGSWMQANLASLDVLALMKAQEALSTDRLQAAPPFIWKPLLGLYAQGQAFLERRADPTPQLRAANFVDIEEAFQELPKSTEQILHPAKYWDAEKRDSPVLVAFDRAGLAEGWEVVLEDTFGELMLALLSEPLSQRSGMSASPVALASLRYTNQAAAGWGGDRYVLLRNGEAEILLLVTTWDTRKDGDEFQAAMDSLVQELCAQAAFDDSDRGYLVQRNSDTRVDWMAWRGTDQATGRKVAQSLGVSLSSD